MNGRMHNISMEEGQDTVTGINVTYYCPFLNFPFLLDLYQFSHTLRKVGQNLFISSGAFEGTYLIRV